MRIKTPRQFVRSYDCVHFSKRNRIATIAILIAIASTTGLYAQDTDGLHWHTNAEQAIAQADSGILIVHVQFHCDFL